MSELTQPFIYDDFSSGMIDSAAVSDSLMPKNAVRKAVNCVFDLPRGSITGRLGSTIVGTGINTAIKGLANFRDAGAGTSNRLVATDSSGNTYYLNGSSFIATLSGDTTNLKTRFVTFLDRMARLNGTDAVRSWDGSAGWASSGDPLDVGNWPSSTRFAAVFNSKMYTAGALSAPDTLYYSSIPSGGAISWSGNNSLQVNPNDGNGGITGLIITGTVLLVFKRTSLYRWDGSSTFANEVISVGTPSNESLAKHDSGWVYFFGVGKNTVGAYRTSGGYPQKISLNINRWFKAILPSNYDNVSAFCDDDHYCLSVGSITIDGQTYTNAWFVYTISMQTWHIEDHYNSFTVFSSYVDASNNITVVSGATDGTVQTINSGTTDNGQAISSECEFSPIVFSTRARTKNVSASNIIAYSNFQQGLEFQLKVDQGKYQPLGSIQKYEQRFPALGVIKGKRFYPKIIVSNSQDAWQFDGFEFNLVKDEGYFQ